MPKKPKLPAPKTAAEALERVKQERAEMVRKDLNRIADLLERANFIHKIDHPEGGIFIEGEGTINALSNLNESVRQHHIVASVHVPKGTFDCGAW